VSNQVNGRTSTADTQADNRPADSGLRILRIATDSYPDVLGGGALHAHELSSLQAEMGHDVTLLTSDHGDREKPRQETRAGYEVRRYRQIARPFGNSITPGMVPAMRRLLATHDIVHAHSHLYFSTNMAALLARLDSTPLVITNHGLHSQTAPMAVQKAYAPLAKFTFNSADRVLCYTETDRNRLRERGVTAPISVIHNGIDCDTFVPDASDDTRRQVLFVGRLKETKGVRELLDAFDVLVDDLRDVTLRFVGKGPLRDELEDTVTEYGLTDQVMFAGRVPNEELPETYAESAVFALPSEVEGFPRTVLEAMACGTPVVTSELPQLQSVVDQFGETAPHGDVEALSTALKRLLANPKERERLGREARERAHNQYSWMETVRQTTDLYYELLE
jgi:glycogen(starch) synthase